MAQLNTPILDLLKQPALCFLATSMPDGSPQITEVSVDTDGTHVIINSVETHVKMKNIRRDPRVALAVAFPNDPSRYAQIRGYVSHTTTDGAVEHIENLAQKYTGQP